MGDNHPQLAVCLLVTPDHVPLSSGKLRSLRLLLLWFIPSWGCNSIVLESPQAMLVVLSSALSPRATALAVLASATTGVAVPGTGSGFSCALPGLALPSQQAGSRTPLPKPREETCPSLATQCFA